ncbi:MAG TPA: hypothetical protein VFJ00_04360 [Candidatus Limnocylindria bacterium]|nr:hypothetical protein [Candidatus Limnocylindria bacterium]
MSDPDGWLRNAGTAARVAADRGDLWLPGTLGAFSYVAWLPLVLTVAAGPRTSDLAFLGASLFTSALFPFNLLLIAVLAALGILVACLLAAFAEASLLRAAGLGTPGRSMTRELEATFSVMLVAVLPAVAVAAALISGAAAVAPAEFGAPDLGVPLALRIVLRLLPLLAGLALLALLGQAYGAVAIRKAVGPGALPVGDALRAALRDLIQHPGRRLGLGLSAFIADLLAFALALALLRVLWAPIAAELAGGQLVSPSALLLLLGFVAVWLTVSLAFGALHVWVSTWWSLELGANREAGSPEAQEARV